MLQLTFAFNFLANEQKWNTGRNKKETSNLIILTASENTTISSMKCHGCMEENRVLNARPFPISTCPFYKANKKENLVLVRTKACSFFEEYRQEKNTRQ